MVKQSWSTDKAKANKIKKEQIKKRYKLIGILATDFNLELFRTVTFNLKKKKQKTL